MVRPPQEVATAILAGLFGEAAIAPSERTLTLARFQEAAVARARRALDRWGGAIIADDVGLGKTYMAVALIEEALARNEEILVAVPAPLRATWVRLLGRLRPPADGPQLQVRSHAQLSRGSYPPGLRGRLGFVVVDEAHRFRNPRSRRHAALSELAAGARVVLLTATPVNNGSADLLTLLRLLGGDHTFHSLGVPSLRELFDPVRGPDQGALSRVLQEIMIRRTRSMVVDPGAPLPRRSPPRVVRYADARLAPAAHAIAGLELAPLATFESGARANGATDVRALVRLGLLKRLESGAAAVRISLDRHRAFLRMFASAMEAGHRLTPLPGQGHGATDPHQLVFLPLVSDPWPEHVPVDPVRQSVGRDLRALEQLLATLRGPDPKLAALDLLLRSLAPEKVVVFSEFRDTVAALWEALSARYRVGRVDGEGGWLGRQRASRMAVLQRFAPMAHGRASPPDLQRVDVLLATDVAAEGLNLQDAPHVVCYDLPWNPVRILQRVGRIDRLGSPHQEVFPYLFVPVSGLEEMLGLTRRIRRKLGEINALMGGQEGRDLLAQLASGTSDTAAHVLDRLEAEAELPMERLRALWEQATPRHSFPNHDGPRTLASSVPLPPGPAPENGPPAVVLARVGTRVALVEVDARGAGEPGARAVRLLERALQTPPDGSPGKAPAAWSAAGRAADAAARYLAPIQARAAAPRPIQSSHPAARIAAEIRARLADDLDALDPTLLDRADALLHRLAGPIPAAWDGRLPTLAEDAQRIGCARDLIEAVEALCGLDASPPLPADPPPAVRILAVLMESDGAQIG
jgi:hypothetical protein